MGPSIGGMRKANTDGWSSVRTCLPEVHVTVRGHIFLANLDFEHGLLGVLAPREIDALDFLHET